MLTELQEAFCQAYTGVCQGNATVAYKMAGYTAKNQAVAQANGPTLLKKKEVQARIKELREKQKDDPNILTPKQMQQFLTYVVRLVMEDARIPPPTIAEGLKAMEMLARMQGLFLQKQQVSFMNAPPVVIRDDLAERKKAK